MNDSQEYDLLNNVESIQSDTSSIQYDIDLIQTSTAQISDDIEQIFFEGNTSILFEIRDLLKQILEKLDD